VRKEKVYGARDVVVRIFYIERSKQPPAILVPKECF